MARSATIIFQYWYGTMLDVVLDLNARFSHGKKRQQCAEAAELLTEAIAEFAADAAVTGSTPRKKVQLLSPGKTSTTRWAQAWALLSSNPDIATSSGVVKSWWTFQKH